MASRSTFFASLGLVALALAGEPAQAFRIIDAGPALGSPRPVYVR